MKKYFINCLTIEELKKEYKKLAFANHPDLGGDIKIMQEINFQYDLALVNLQAQTSKGIFDDEFKNIVNNIINLSNINIEVIGSWLWVSGDTKTVRAELKAAGLWYASKKVMWFWHTPEDKCRTSRGSIPIEDIRSKYGSTLINSNHTTPNKPKGLN
jgi:hypothetical protein